jgi:uncharacterized protein YciI
MRWAVIFEDAPRMREARELHEQAHLEYLRAKQTEILMAGGLRTETGAPFTGGLWVLASMQREQAVKLIEEDPYFLHSRRAYTLMQWGNALQDISVKP